MAKNDNKSAVSFQSESGTVDFQPEQAGQTAELDSSQDGGQEGGGLGAMTENVNWNKVGIGVGAAAAVAGAAYAAKKFIGRNAEDDQGSGGGKKRS
ncbi:hypothetical protein [Allosphingosinicella sp.]|uniref:hypothetical protein n=1 Tax=Allosphingosinicella sp. TaxID=2823234 RepID=UPI002F22261F